jgi:nucleoside-diphosphate-sugar epimerase
VLDLYLYGDDVLRNVSGAPGLEEIKGDIRDLPLLKGILPRCDAVIHLACISNDPSFELNPALGRSINYDAFPPLVDAARERGVRRFVYASSSSVYGVRDEPDVTEEMTLEPLTDYSKYKALCEDVLRARRAPGFVPLVLRPATVCGYSPRLRLDLTVNILTSHAVNNRLIKVFGGKQLRPNIHIDDITDLYVESLSWPEEVIDGEIFNAGYENHTVADVARMVKGVVGEDVEIVTEPTDDHRSYHISSAKLRSRLNFLPRRTIQDAVQDLAAAFAAGKVPNAMTETRYYNIRRMQELNLS